MKKKSNKIAKLEKNRISIFTNNLDYCIICGNRKQHIHEVYYGNNRINSMKYGCTLPLCMNCHNNIHNNHELDLYYKKLMQEKFEEVYDEDFLSIFKRNYL